MQYAVCLYEGDGIYQIDTNNYKLQPTKIREHNMYVPCTVICDKT